MSSSRHPVALRLERQVGGATRLLATVMALPLVDGIFPALVIAGAVSTVTGVVETGLLIFGGSATVAVILAEMDGTRREHVRAVLLLGLLIVPLAAVEAALAPTVGALLDQATFKRFAGLVILAVAAKTASARIGEFLPRPAVIVSLGIVASVQPSAFAPGSFELVSDPWTVVAGASAAAVGVAFALAVAVAAPRLRGVVDIDRFRFGSSVALGVLALSVLDAPGLPTDAPVALVVMAVTALFAYDPDAAIPADGASSDDDAGDAGAAVDPDPTDDPVGDAPSPDVAAPARADVAAPARAGVPSNAIDSRSVAVEATVARNGDGPSPADAPIVLDDAGEWPAAHVDDVRADATNAADEASPHDSEPEPTAAWADDRPDATVDPDDATAADATADADAGRRDPSPAVDADVDANAAADTDAGDAGADPDPDTDTDAEESRAPWL